MRNHRKQVLAILFTLLISSSSVVASGPTPATRGHLMIVDTAFSVPAGKALSYAVSLSGRGRVTGRFRATGGSGNDIHVLILDSDAYENWLNGHSVNTYYNSGKITVANINVTLGRGDYVLVFSNTFSANTPKAVEAHVALDW